MDYTRPFTIEIDRELEEIVPRYVENRKNDLETMAVCLERGDFDNIRVLGHRMKGSGAGYGFNEITELGKLIEFAAKDGDAGAIRTAHTRLAEYVRNLRIVYIDA